MTTIAPLALTISEADFQTTLLDYARLRGWMCTHFRPARTVKGWATALQGDPGFPDLVLARDGVVLVAELKRHGKKASPAQLRWLAAVGACGRLWGPANWPEIFEELR